MNFLKPSRRAFLAGGVSLAAASLAAPAIVRAAPTKMKFSGTAGVQNPIAIRIVEATNRIREETGGEIDITFFPAGQLGGEVDSISQLRTGAIDFTHLSAVTLSSVVPSASISGLGFAFGSYDKVWAAMDGELGALVRADMEKVGIVGMERMMDYSFRHLTATDKQINTPEDLQGFKMRVPPGPLWTSLFNALGAAPTTVAIAEVYTGLLTGVIDGTDLPLLTMADLKIIEVQKFVSLTSHMWDGPWLIANKASIESLSADHSAIVKKNFEQAALDQRGDVVAFNESFIGSAGSSGLTIIEPDREAFRKKLVEAGFYKEWKGRFSPEAWTALEKVTGPLG
ncbi:TRAP transporter substrate-binding protein [Aquibium sp. LZ166]|uniref:TRAP transporter substrate-binding protein n=1 Tax=Aquibium pacificus TaxID=3153579 RepID=A0ABV3SKH5_9HYPH